MFQRMCWLWGGGGGQLEKQITVFPPTKFSLNGVRSRHREGYSKSSISRVDAECNYLMKSSLDEVVIIMSARGCIPKCPTCANRNDRSCMSKTTDTSSLKPSGQTVSIGFQFMISNTRRPLEAYARVQEILAPIRKENPKSALSPSNTAPEPFKTKTKHSFPSRALQFACSLYVAGAVFDCRRADWEGRFVRRARQFLNPGTSFTSKTGVGSNQWIVVQNNR